jgi:alpha-glucosidase (family GH31 glycosyl hydrolase)
MAAEGWTTDVWLSPWAIGERGEVAEENGWLAPGSPRALDLTNADAVAWLERDLATFLGSPEGRLVDGFFLDRADEPDVTSTVEAVYADGRNGRQVHNWYPVEFGRIVRGVLDRVRPDTGFAIQRPGYSGSQQHVLRWGGDTRSREGLAIPEAPIETAPSTDLGLRSVLISMQRAAFMGTPYWGSDIGGYTAWVDREVYARWIEVGFASPLMRFHGMGGTPWAPTITGEPDEELLAIYRRYVELRHAMQPYLVDAAAEAATAAMPMVRPLVFAWPDEPDALDRWDQWMLGPDLLVAPVWSTGAREREVWIPPGEWIDFWDRDATIEGPTLVTVDVPLDRLPMWVRPGSELLTLSVGR